MVSGFIGFVNSTVIGDLSLIYRVCQGAGHGTQGGLMEDEIDAGTEVATGGELSDITFRKTEALPLIGADEMLRISDL